MPKIRHLAVIAMDPEKLAVFYSKVFEMEIVNRNRGSVFLTDGYLNVAIIPNRGEGKPSGLNHIGFHVEDSNVIAERMKEFECRLPAERPANRAYADLRGTDPEGNTFDLCEHDFQQAKNGDVIGAVKASAKKASEKIKA